jgi:bacterioferritin (cytochrome b1)
MLNPLKIDKTVPEMITSDQEAELSVIRVHNEAIALSHEVGNQASVDLLSDILKVE